ncbi:MAG: hypothetical protein M1822_006855 [Bathelium mastoideum]|nr:MAG: hypothetical protein M1822_006855 [Bathelium mastoideum]
MAAVEPTSIFVEQNEATTDQHGEQTEATGQQQDGATQKDITMLDEIPIDPDEDDGPYVDEELEKALANVTQAVGARNALELQTIPVEILECYKKMNPVIRQLWTIPGQKPNPVHLRVLDQVNSEIQARNIKKAEEQEKEGIQQSDRRQPKAYEYPFMDMCKYMEVLGNLQTQYKSLEDGLKKDETLKKLGEEIILWKTKWQREGFQWQDFLSAVKQAELNAILKKLNKNPDTFFGPNHRQKEIADQAIPPIQAIFKDIANQALVEKNLREIHQVAENLKVFNKKENYSPKVCVVEMDQNLKNGFLSASDQDKELHKELRNALSRLLTLVGYPADEILSPNLMPSSDMTSSQQQLDPKTDPKTSAVTVEIKDEYIPMAIEPIIAGPITAFGLVVGVQKLGNGSRIWINYGTKQRPLFMLAPGSSLGAHTAQDLLEQKTVVEVGQDLIPAKNRRLAHMRKVHHIAWLPQETPKEREPITSLYIEWKDDKDNPFREKYPLWQWVSRSYMLGFAGPRLGNGIVNKLRSNHSENDASLAKLREQNIHPDTLQPLTDTDKTNTPWLFKSCGPVLLEIEPRKRIKTLATKEQVDLYT